MNITYKIGNLVIYRQKLAQVISINAEKIAIKLADGETRNVRAKDIDFLHAGNANSPLPTKVAYPECQEVAELMEQEVFNFSDFIELAFGEYTPATAWSGYELLMENLYFTGSLTQGVSARPQHDVAAILAKQEEKNAAIVARQEFLERIRSGNLLESDLPMLRDVELVAYKESENSKTLKELGIEATPEKAQLLLLKLGVWSYLNNPWPRRFEVDLNDPELEVPAQTIEERVDLTHLHAMAIDDAESHDPDDAISLDGDLIWVHVADPASVVTPQSELDNEAALRGSNLYIPETVSHMLPQELTNRFGLGLNEHSPALSFAIKINDDGNASLEKFVLSTVKVTRYHYDSIQTIWESAELQKIRKKLELFKQHRIDNGALLINLPEVKIKLKNDKVEITQLENSAVREFVANAMLATGSAVAKYAVEQQIPMPFVVQPQPEENLSGDSMVAMFAMRKSCLPSAVVTTEGRHAGLGLEPYIRVTSPLRRYSDLLAHQQLRRILTNQEPMNSDEIETRIVLSEYGATARKKLERNCNEYWTLVFLKQNPTWSGQSILVYRQDDRLTWLIPELAFEYKNRASGKVELGEEKEVKIVSIEPATLSLRLS